MDSLEPEELNDVSFIVLRCTVCELSGCENKTFSRVSS